MSRQTRACAVLSEGLCTGLLRKAGPKVRSTSARVALKGVRQAQCLGDADGADGVVGGGVDNCAGLGNCDNNANAAAPAL